ncbi:MAG TPA: sulfite exporter TauE/SafE family protein [Aliidongia sp.]|uniref:sulfite exporter TauE/SafE family protein n=1 Tax=Aliidongia sp. TaxID=1914230 RepID=UPI002DDD35F6|nr:sulfite exporter TauE/SafE family protein [Aliidongia sp.]HEV2675698.1 sulfite exporter TauE/SafE family protein [Aliidongia sp.]
MADPWFSLILITLTFLLAGFVKGVIGLGLPTVAVGLLGLVMLPAQAAALLVVPSMVTNLWQLFAGPRFGPLVRRLWPMLLMICVGTWCGAGLLTDGSAGRATAALGAALIVYAILGLSRLQLKVPPRWERPLSPIIGGVTGLVTAATGVFVLPAVPFIQALDFEREDLIQALGLSFTVSTLALAAGLAHDGAFDAATAWHSGLTVIPALAGMGIGQWVRVRVRPALFRTCFFVGLLALGADLLIRGL